MMVFCFTYNSPSEIEPHTKEAHHLITESSLLTEQHILYIDLALLSLNYVLLLFAAHTEMPANFESQHSERTYQLRL